MARKEKGRTRRQQYDEFLTSVYKRTCRDLAVLGFDFGTAERQKQFHYELMVLALDSYLLYDGLGPKAHIICAKGCADEIRRIAVNNAGKEFRVMLDETI